MVETVYHPDPLAPRRREYIGARVVCDAADCAASTSMCEGYATALVAALTAGWHVDAPEGRGDYCPEHR